MKCKNKVAIVAGAAGNGMGRSIGLTLAREGAKVVVNYLTSSESAETIVRHIENRGGNALALRADVTKEDGCKELVDAAIEAYGQIDICVFNPGAGWHPEPVEKLNAQGALDDTFRELAPIYYLMPLVLTGMFERKWGCLIGLGLDSKKPSPSYAYNVGKAARSHALLSCRDRLWSHGVTVNLICPGPVDALPSFDSAVELCDHGTSWENRENVTPQDIAEGVAVLCSEEGRFITGCELPFAFK